MAHVYKFMCYAFVELKLKINTRSLFNRTLNRAHPPLLCCALLALRSIQLMTGEPRPRYNALQLLGVSGACALTGIHFKPGITYKIRNWSLKRKRFLEFSLALYKMTSPLKSYEVTDT